MKRIYRVWLHVYPSQLQQVFHIPGSVIDGGETDDFVDVACKFYLYWQSDFPESTSLKLVIDGYPEESEILTNALFR